MGRFLVALVLVALLAAAALIGYAYLGEAHYAPQPTERRVPVPLDLDVD
jgi:hypothetical protein